MGFRLIRLIGARCSANIFTRATVHGSFGHSCLCFATSIWCISRLGLQNRTEQSGLWQKDVLCGADFEDVCLEYMMVDRLLLVLVLIDASLLFEYGVLIYANEVILPE